MIGGWLRSRAWLGLALTLALGAVAGLAGAEDPDPAPPGPPAVRACGAGQQSCSAGDGATWCCPVQSTGAMVCCGAVADVCHACDLEQLPDEVQIPIKSPSSADLPRIE